MTKKKSSYLIFFLLLTSYHFSKSNPIDEVTKQKLGPNIYIKSNEDKRYPSDNINININEMKQDIEEVEEVEEEEDSPFLKHARRWKKLDSNNLSDVSAKSDNQEFNLGSNKYLSFTSFYSEPNSKPRVHDNKEEYGNYKKIINK